MQCLADLRFAKQHLLSILFKPQTLPFINCNIAFIKDFVELPPDDMQKLLVHNTVSIINIKIARWLNEVSNYLLPLINYVMGVVWSDRLAEWQTTREGVEKK